MAPINLDHMRNEGIREAVICQPAVESIPANSSVVEPT
jgi:hypothetical protein